MNIDKFEIQDYIKNETIIPLYLLGDVLDVISNLPSNSVDCCITSPPYWQGC